MKGSIVPMTGSIVCGVDGSDVSRGAVRVAQELGVLLERRVVFVQVVEPGAPGDEINVATDRLQHLAQSAPNPTYDALWLLDVGHPADRLVAAAEDEQAGLLVVGSHGPRASLLGSVSAEVSRRAPCPVVVVPPGVEGVAESAVASEDARLVSAGAGHLRGVRSSDDPTCRSIGS